MMSQAYLSNPMQGMADSSVDSSEVLTPTEMDRRAKAAGKTVCKGPHLVYTLPCDCLGCVMQYRSVDEQRVSMDFLYEGSMTESETAALSRGFFTSVFEDLQNVRSVLHRHGDLIHKRWLKKSNTKRKTYLKQLRPNMYESHHTSLDLQITKCVDAIPIRQYRETFLLPYMTFETLSKDGPKTTSSAISTCRPHVRGMGNLRQSTITLGLVCRRF